MRKIRLFIAMSLDGYIADRNGKVNWLKGQCSNVENIDTYSTFIKEIDTVIMGWKTYHQIVTELSPTEWIYSNLTSYVVTHRSLQSTDNLKFVKDSPCDIVRELREKQGKGIWICGGANIVQSLMSLDLIDEYYISVIPTLLGAGVRLWGGNEKELELELLRTEAYNGIMELVYRRRQSK